MKEGVPAQKGVKFGPVWLHNRCSLLEITAKATPEIP
jgi:hypothetical protein